MVGYYPVMTTSQPFTTLPWWRALLIGVSTASVSSAAHLMGGGQLPSLLTGVAVAAALCLLARPVTGAAMSQRKWLVVLTIWQGLAHSLWSISAAIDAAPLAASGHHHHGVDGPLADAGAFAIVPMLSAHLLGVAVTGVLAAVLERSVARISQWLAPLMASCAQRGVVVPGRVLPSRKPHRVLRSQPHFLIPVDRGPPAGVAA